MKKIVLLFVFLALGHNRAVAQQTYQSCNSVKSICVKIITIKRFISTETSKFVAEITSAISQNTEIIKFDLWMDMNGHGHPSSPLTWSKISENPLKFSVTEAEFFMPGDWQIIVDYKLDQVAGKIIIPVLVKE
jgi:hypothetical protein